MGLLNGGRDIIAAHLTNYGTPVHYDNANAAIAVGNGTASFDKAHTDLQGASKDRAGMETSYPTTTNNVLVFKSSFGDGHAEFAWEEWGVVNNPTSGGTFLNRAVSSMGTKAAGSTWVITATVTVTN